MITEVRGDLLKAAAEALVNPVNTDGVMGAGLAAQFYSAYQNNYDVYKAACRRGEVRLGRMFVYERDQLERVRYIINFPTKSHWKLPSALGDIAEGLGDLRQVISDYEIRSIAVPALGCGLGSLDWSDVRPMIEACLGDLDGVRVLLYPPR